MNAATQSTIERQETLVEQHAFETLHHVQKQHKQLPSSGALAAAAKNPQSVAGSSSDDDVFYDSVSLLPVSACASSSEPESATSTARPSLVSEPPTDALDDPQYGYYGEPTARAGHHHKGKVGISSGSTSNNTSTSSMDDAILEAAVNEPHSRSGSSHSVDESGIIDLLTRLGTAAELVRHWGYPCEEHETYTSDGYRLGLQRIPGRKGDPTAFSAPKPYDRPPVIIWHGLSICSDVFVCNVRPELNLALVLADAGYDVWLGNTRGNKYSKGHRTLDPNRSSREYYNYWNFSIDHLARYDLPAGVDYVLDVTGHSKVAYIGYSQGTAQAFAGLSIDDELNQKISIFLAMAPAMKPLPIQNRMVTSLVKAFDAKVLYRILGSGSFLPFAHTVRNSLPSSIYASIMQLSMRALFEWQCEKFGPTNRKEVLYGHIFSDASVKCVVHWFQIMQDEQFKPYDAGSSARRAQSMLHTQMQTASAEPAYPTKHISIKMHLFAGTRDNISDQTFLRKHLPDHMVMHSIDDYEHMDFLWATDAKEKVWDKIIELIGETVAAG